MKNCSNLALWREKIDDLDNEILSTIIEKTITEKSTYDENKVSSLISNNSLENIAQTADLELNTNQSQTKSIYFNMLSSLDLIGTSFNQESNNVDQYMNRLLELRCYVIPCEVAKIKKQLNGSVIKITDKNREEKVLDNVMNQLKELYSNIYDCKFNDKPLISYSTNLLNKSFSNFLSRLNQKYDNDNEIVDLLFTQLEKLYLNPQPILNFYQDIMDLSKKTQRDYLQLYKQDNLVIKD